MGSEAVETEEERRQRKERKRARKEAKRLKREKRARRREEREEEDDDGESVFEGGNEMVSLPPTARNVVNETSNLDDEEEGMDGIPGRTHEMLDHSDVLTLKPDHENRPVWVASDGRIFLETFSTIYKQAYDFLVAIAEPVSRPELVHEYRLTPYALYAAVSVGLEAESIIAVLSRLSKTNLPDEIPKMIRKCTKTCGKAKLVLHRSRSYVQTKDEKVLRLLLEDEVISKARVDKTNEFTRLEGTQGGIVVAGADEAVSDANTLKAINAALEDDDEAEDVLLQGTQDKQQFLSFEIHSEEAEHVKRRCLELDYPLMEEYDFRNDTANRDIDIDLKPIAKIRPYQEKSLAKMFGNGRARSGVIVLPCGAGKSLVGVTAACTVKKTCLCLCTSSVSVEQWRYQFCLWSTLPREKVGRFTAGGGSKNFLEDVVVTTYSMISHSGRRAAETQKMLDLLKSREWGLLLLDEVHVVPANVFRRVLGVVKAHTKLGLTATLLREDHKIGDINFLIGPKLYEANWLDLQRAGYLATVQCAEVWCPMTAEFFREYLNTSAGKRKLLYAMNPNKIRATEYLVKFHEARGDKIIIFSDNVFALRYYAELLKRPFIYGPTTQTERLRVLHQFQHNPALGTILLSKVGDTSIDIPEANVLIQVSSHYGSRRQEAQRLGRILRPKPRAGQNFNAFFYSMVSTDTQEMFYSSKRQQFLVDQGYAFKVIVKLDGMDRDNSLHFNSRDDQLNLLADVLAADETEATERIEDLDEAALGVDRRDHIPGARRVKGSVGALTGASGVRYREEKKAIRPLTTDEIMGRAVVRHSLFRTKIKKPKPLEL